MKESGTDQNKQNHNMQCKICGNISDNELITATERMFGHGDKFEYFICSKCRCLQIKDIPEDIDKYYPSDYYSYQEAKFPSKLNWFNFYLKKSLINYYMGYFDITGFLLSSIFQNPFPWIRKREINFDSKILDIGSGAGRKLLSLQRSGFRNLTGIDPFIEKDIHYTNGLRILKKEITEIDEKYDLIMLHHSFEHMSNPGQVIRNINSLLNPNGCILLRIPIADSYAWHKYREYWSGLDAPRHFFLHTPQSINVLLNDTDLKTDEIIYDSTEFQFTGSEKYMKNLLFSAPDDMFTKKELKDFKKEAKKLNKTKQGDWACFFLKKTQSDK
jgi:SAM-dependent methyltransferase